MVIMALPMDYDGLRTDDASERTDNVDDYKRTCMDFIEDISHDYEAWVDYYKLPEDEDKKRRAGIHATIKRTNEWIAKVAQTIKGVDVVMNDGIQKMAESTAGNFVEHPDGDSKRSNRHTHTAKWIDTHHFAAAVREPVWSPSSRLLIVPSSNCERKCSRKIR